MLFASCHWSYEQIRVSLSLIFGILQWLQNNATSIYSITPMSDGLEPG